MIVGSDVIWLTSYRYLYTERLEKEEEEENELSIAK